MKLFTRYLLKAHIGPFFFAFVALTGVILINTLAKELADLAGKGLPVLVVLEFFMLSLPANIALTLPMAVLVAVLHAFSSLAAENEITALRASGVDLRRVALPLVLLAGLIAGGMVWFNNQVLPAANYRWRVLMTDVAQTRSLLFLQPQVLNPIPGASGATPYYLEAHEIDSSTGLMRNVSIYDISGAELTRTIEADSGRMAFDTERTDLILTLFDGTMREVDFSDQKVFRVVAFKRQVMRMEEASGRLERTMGSGFRTDRDMTLGMMDVYIDSLRAESVELRRTASGEHVPVASDTTASPDLVTSADVGDIGDISAETGAVAADTGVFADTIGAAARNGGGQADSAAIAQANAGGSAAPVPAGDLAQPAGEANAYTTIEDEVAAAAGTEGVAAPTAEELRYAEARLRNIEQQIREYQVEIQKKFAIASASLVFVLMGIPIALRFPRGGVGMVIAVSLSVFGIYYVGLIGGETLGDKGYVPPILAMWATNVIFGVLGVVGYMKLGREQGTGRGGGWGDVPRWLRMPRRRRPQVAEAP